MADDRKLWWMIDPTLEKIRRDVLEEIYSAADREVDDKPDPVLTDVLSGGSWQQLHRRFRMDG